MSVDESNTLQHLTRQARQMLSDGECTNAEFEARRIVEVFAGVSPLTIAIEPMRVVGHLESKNIRAAVDKRLAGMPLHRIIGERAFCGLDLELSADTLEPRDDTETLVRAVERYFSQRGEIGKALNILDLGTGTGALLLALLQLLPGSRGLGVDFSPGAVETARKNATRHAFDQRARFAVGSWFAPVDARYDIIVSNPPYIRSDVIPTLSAEVRDHDPHLALDGGPDGLSAYREIANHAQNYLLPDGIVVLETGFDQHDAVIALFGDQSFELMERLQDLNGQDRGLIFKPN